MKPATLQDYKRRMMRVLVYIQEHLDESPSLEELAGVACFSPFHFHRLFKGMIGESVQEHVRRLRLERAAVRLKLTSTPVTRLAFETGYESHEAFTRSFKELFGLAPSRFRASRRTPGSPSLGRVQYSANGRLHNLRTPPLRSKNMRIELKRIPEMTVAFMRQVGAYGESGALWDRFLPIVGKEGVLGGDTLFIGICHDDPDVTPANRVRYDACVTVESGFAPPEDVGLQKIVGGDYAITTHFGPYDELSRTYAKLFGQWLPRSGWELRSTPCFEVYLNDPQSNAPTELLTDIYLPLQSIEKML